MILESVRAPRPAAWPDVEPTPLTTGCPNCQLLADEAAGLRAAIESRDVIGQAKGIIIASTGCLPDEAFELLRQQSQAENRKLRDIAAELVESKLRHPLTPGLTPGGPGLGG